MIEIAGALCLSKKAVFHSLNSISINIIKVHSLYCHLSFHGWVNALIYNTHSASAKLLYDLIPSNSGFLHSIYNGCAACSARGGCLLALP